MQPDVHPFAVLNQMEHGVELEGDVKELPSFFCCPAVQPTVVVEKACGKLLCCCKLCSIEKSTTAIEVLHQLVEGFAALYHALVDFNSKIQAICQNLLQHWQKPFAFCSLAFQDWEGLETRLSVCDHRQSEVGQSVGNSSFRIDVSHFGK